jgi:hypothetical protein
MSRTGWRGRNEGNIRWFVIRCKFLSKANRFTTESTGNGWASDAAVRTIHLGKGGCRDPSAALRKRRFASVGMTGFVVGEESSERFADWVHGDIAGCDFGVLFVRFAESGKTA